MMATLNQKIICLMSSKNKKRSASEFDARPYGRYTGSTIVPCFRCYLSCCGKRCEHEYIVRAVDIQRFIDQWIKRSIMYTVEIVDYMFEELPHGTLFKVK